MVYAVQQTELVRGVSKQNAEKQFNVMGILEQPANFREKRITGVGTRTYLGEIKCTLNMQRIF